ncbi:hypothetical protein KEM60_03259 [Austwickia sp. TVS 96-490-7B]|nr:hypothetical protein [Austwickia sp. TVS 96-490-7B]
MRAYLISMGIRTVCFVLAVAVYLLLHHTWAAVIIGIAAVVLPYPAVVLANNASQHRSHTMIEAPPRHELTTGSAMAAPTEPPSSDPTGSQRSS